MNVGIELLPLSKCIGSRWGCHLPLGFVITGRGRVAPYLDGSKQGCVNQDQLTFLSQRRWWSRASFQMTKLSILESHAGL